MIQMKYVDLLHPKLLQVLGKIANTPMAPAKSYELNKLLSAVRSERTKIQDESVAILKNFVQFENGQPAPVLDADGAPTNEVKFIEPFSATHPEYTGTFDAFEQKIAEVGFRPWSLEMLADVKLSAMEIDMLGSLITDKPYLQAVEASH
jgi:hypothetical protein